MENLPIWEAQWPHKSRWSSKEGNSKDVNAPKGQYCSGLNRCCKSRTDSKRLIRAFMISVINMLESKTMFCCIALQCMNTVSIPSCLKVLFLNTTHKYSAVLNVLTSWFQSSTDYQNNR